MENCLIILLVLTIQCAGGNNEGKFLFYLFPLRFTSFIFGIFNKKAKESVWRSCETIVQILNLL